MTRGILIAGNESSFFNALGAEAGKRVERYAAAAIPNRLIQSPHGAEEGGAEKRILLQWNPGSPISARTLVVAAENRLGQINEAILACSPPALYRQPEALSPSEIEVMVNDQIRGWFFLARELLLMFKRRGGGILALAVPGLAPGGGREGPADLCGPPAAAFFRAFAQGLLSASQEEGPHVLGFTAPESAASSLEEAHFASFIFKIMEEPGRRTGGKWHKYGKLGIFNR